MKSTSYLAETEGFEPSNGGNQGEPKGTETLLNQQLRVTTCPSAPPTFPPECQLAVSVAKARRYDWWAANMFARPAMVAGVIGPCENLEQLDSAIDAVVRIPVQDSNARCDRSVPEGLIQILEESAAYIHADFLGGSPDRRYPIVDELAGFAGMLKEAGSEPAKTRLCKLTWILKAMVEALPNMDSRTDREIYAAGLLASLNEMKP